MDKGWAKNSSKLLIMNVDGISYPVFLNQEMRRFGNPWGFIMEYFITRGFMGRKMQKMMEIGMSLKILGQN